MIRCQFNKVKNVHYNFFTAERGFSSFPYNSLNCSFNTQDSYDNIIKNMRAATNDHGRERKQGYLESRSRGHLESAVKKDY